MTPSERDPAAEADGRELFVNVDRTLPNPAVDRRRVDGDSA